MKDILLFGVVPILAAVFGAVAMPVIHVIRRKIFPPWLDDKHCLIGNYRCQWYLDGVEAAYANDRVEITDIQGSHFSGKGTDDRFFYKLEGNISRGNVIAFYYIILNKKNSLTGSGTMKMNPMGSCLEGRWYGYLAEDQLRGGRVVWNRMSEPDLP